MHASEGSMRKGNHDAMMRRLLYQMMMRISMDNNRRIIMDISWYNITLIYPLCIGYPYAPPLSL